MPHGPGGTGIWNGGGLKSSIAPVGVGRGDSRGTPIAPSLGWRLDRRLATRVRLKTARSYSGLPPGLLYLVVTARRGWAIQWSHLPSVRRPGGAPRLSPPRSSDWGGGVTGDMDVLLAGCHGDSAHRDLTSARGGPDRTLYFSLARGSPSAKNLLIVYAHCHYAGSRSPGVYGNQRVPSVMVLVLRKVWWGAGSASLLVHSTFGLRVWPATAVWIFLSYSLSCRFLTRGGLGG